MPEKIEVIGREVMGDKFVRSSALGGDGWLITYEGKIESGWSDERLSHVIRSEAMKLAQESSPSGMTVSRLIVIYRANFNDGMGNETEGKLIQLEVPAETLKQINWGNPEAIQFDRIFTTRSCHRTFRDGWNRAKAES